MTKPRRDTKAAVTDVACAARAYIEFGWALVPVPAGTKGPRTNGWNLRDNCWTTPHQVPAGYQGSIGLAHLYSQTMTLDVDNLDLARAYFQQHNIDLIALLATGVRISSGRPGRAKLIYHVPSDIDPATLLTINDQANGFELRCATKNGMTVQDCVPPTVHPDTGKPYIWAGPNNDPEPWRAIPIAPTALLEHWYSRLQEFKARTQTGPVDPAVVPVVQSALNAIDPDLPYPDWLAVGMALDSAGLGDLWHEWSAGGSKYQPDDCEPRLIGFKADRGRTIGTLFHYAHVAGWDASTCWGEATAALGADEPDYNRLLPKLAALMAYCRPSGGAQHMALSQLAKSFRVPRKTLEADLAAAQLERRGRELAEGNVTDIADNAASRLAKARKIQCCDDQLWLYDRTHWRELGDKEAGQLLRDLLTEGGWTNIRASLTRMTTEAVAALKYQTVTPNPVVNADPRPIINCQNGEVHILPDGRFELRPHSPESGLLSVLPIEYDAAAKAPTFERVLREAFLPGKRNGRWSEAELAAADDMARHLAEVLGYLIVPVRWNTIWFMFYGRGANAKSLLHETLQMILGRGATLVMPLEELNGSFARSKLIGKTLVVDDDLKANTTLEDDLLKLLSDGKVISTERKYQNGSFEFQNRAALLVLANNWPRLIDLTDGMTRRLHVVKFERRFYKAEELDLLPADERSAAQGDLADLGLKDRLAQELPGILNVLLAGNRRLLERGRKFDVPWAVIAAGQDMRRHANTLVAFIDDVLDRRATGSLPVLKVFESFRNYCSNEGIRWDVSYQQFRDKLDQLGFIEGMTGGVVALRNVGWREGPVALRFDAPGADG